MNRIRNALVSFAIDHSRTATALMVALTLVLCAFFPKIHIDTDPENMVAADSPERLFHNASKRRFALSETVVVGVVNEHDPDGVFNPQTLRRVFELTEFARTLRWPDETDPSRSSGVVTVDMVAPSLVDHMSQGEPGEIRFEWLMPAPPETREAARAIRERAFSNPLLRGRMFSEDGRVICIYLPLTDKHLSYRICAELNKKIEAMGGDETYHIAGVPVAEVAIGVEMFSQMAVGSPMAMAVIFALMMIFFRQWRLVILPMIIASFSVMSTMGLMIALGFDVHILSSMIPIFLMCIGTVSAIHILSEFFDVYRPEEGRRETIRRVMDTLFVPILYTSLTTAAGFASLIFTPIPPAQIFGAFLSIGVMIAWLYTVVFVPAYVMMIPESRLTGFGRAAGRRAGRGLLTATLHSAGRLTARHAGTVLAVLAVLTALSVWGMTKIRVNDNYAKRFVTGHPIRQADIALNRHLGGTYTAYLVLEDSTPDRFDTDGKRALSEELAAFAATIAPDHPRALELARQVSAAIEMEAPASCAETFLDRVAALIEARAATASDEDFFAYEELRGHVGLVKEQRKAFKRPEVLRYMAALQRHLETTDMVGKTTSLAGAVAKVRQEMIDGRPENFRIPDTLQAVAECCFQFQQGHRPGDLWHMVAPDYRHANIWVQLKSGDSSVMKAAVAEVDDYFRLHPPPMSLTHRWAGLHYINLVLQERLIPAMLRSFAGSFVVVFAMMAFLFRSARWGVLCMVPLTVTIVTIYGLVGTMGKDYDLPIAVLGVLALGMAVDFAIHFLQRSRVQYAELGEWPPVLQRMFGEPARAISRNVLVIAIGFLPLLVGPLIPYKTMGVMLFAIMTLSGVMTLLALPSLLTVAEKWFFQPDRKRSSNARPVLSQDDAPVEP